MASGLVKILFLSSAHIVLSTGKDCSKEAKFFSNLTIEPWCRTGIDDCSLRSLKSTFPPLFNATGWAPGKPELLNVTSYCQTDAKGENHAGVNFSWRPPLHSGARHIKGFEIRLEGYIPGYKCSIIRLRESLTQSVIHKTINSTIYPIQRNQNYIISLFSLPRSDYSGRVDRSFKSARCEDNTGSWNWIPKFNITYNEEKKELNVTFTPPPGHFNFTEFILTVASPHFIDEAKINQTYHVFQSIALGPYRISLVPFNPDPEDEKLCKCRNARNQCKPCLTIYKEINVTKNPEPKTTRSPKKKGWTKKVIIKKIKKDKSWKEGKKAKKTRKWMVRVVLPICVFIVSCLAITIWIIYVIRRKRKSKQSGKTAPCLGDGSDNAEGDQSGRNKQVLIFIDTVNSKSRQGSSSFQTELFEIVKGILGHSVTLHKINYSEDIQNHLREYLTRLCRKHGTVTKDNVTKDHDCSETCLLENKTSNKSRFPLDCCLHRDRLVSNIVLCIFVNRHTSVGMLQSLQSVYGAFTIQYDNVECTAVYVSKTKTDIPDNTSGVRVYPYKEELPSLLSRLKGALETESTSNMSDRHGDGSSVFLNNICPKKFVNDITDPYVEIPKDHDADEQWIVVPEGVHIARGPWLEVCKRKRYVSSDSGWGASEHSFRSTPIEEVNETSNKSSLQSITAQDHDLTSSRVHFSNSPKSLILGTTSSLVRPEPICSIISPSTTPSAIKCPSDVFFFPPDDLKTEDSEPAKQNLGEYCVDTSLGQLEYVSCRNHKDASSKVKDKSKNRQSPSIDSLMNMLKAINDESTRYMEHEADIGDVHSVFEGRA